MTVGGTRTEFLLLPGDLVIVEAGEVTLPSGVRVDANEPWWAAQVAEPFAHSRLRGQRPESCIVGILWLDVVAEDEVNTTAAAAAERTLWRLLQNASERVRYGVLLKRADRSPYVLQRESFATAGITSSWDAELGLVYELPETLVEELDDVLEERAAPLAPLAVSAQDQASDEESDEDEQSERRASTAANGQTLLVQLQRGQAPLHRPQRTDRVDYRQWM